MERSSNSHKCSRRLFCNYHLLSFLFCCSSMAFCARLASPTSRMGFHSAICCALAVIFEWKRPAERLVSDRRLAAELVLCYASSAQVSFIPALRASAFIQCVLLIHFSFCAAVQVEKCLEANREHKVADKHSLPSDDLQRTKRKRNKLVNFIYLLSLRFSASFFVW